MVPVGRVLPAGTVEAGAGMSDEATHWWGCDSVHPDCHHPAERILTDLIAELRSAHQPMADLDGEPRLCVQGCGVLPCHSLSAAASAEARLRTLQPPGGSAGADLTKGEGSDDADV